MATPVRLTTTRRGDGTVVVSVAGELDLSNIDLFVDALAAAVTPGGPRVEVDLGGVDYLDSRAIAVLFDHADAIRVVVNPILLPVLTISGLPSVTSVELAA